MVLYRPMLRVTGKEVEPEQTSGEQPDTGGGPAWGFRQPTLHLARVLDRNMHKRPSLVYVHESVKWWLRERNVANLK